jgi:hypothetical protein
MWSPSNTDGTLFRSLVANLPSQGARQIVGSTGKKESGMRNSLSDGDSDILCDGHILRDCRIGHNRCRHRRAVGDCLSNC